MRLFSITITGVKKIVRYMKDFVIQTFVIPRFHFIYFCINK